MGEKLVRIFRRLTGHLAGSGGPIIAGILITTLAVTLSGRINPLSEFNVLSRLEPFIFILIGYYFAVIPARHSQQVLTAELKRNEHKAESAQFAKERMGQEREALEERIKNATSCLSLAFRSGATTDKEILGAALKTAIAILKAP